MAKAASRKYSHRNGRKLTDDELFDLWITVEETADTDDAEVLRDAIAALSLIIADHKARAS